MGLEITPFHTCNSPEFYLRPSRGIIVFAESIVNKERVKKGMMDLSWGSYTMEILFYAYLLMSKSIYIYLNSCWT